MFKDINDYLDKLKKELKGCDPALIQDALSDAEVHLRTALEETLANTPSLSKSKALGHIIEKYGEPVEVASAYREIESCVLPTLAVSKPLAAQSFWTKFFGVLADHHAWGAFLYMLLSAITGCFYGMWALLGASFSLFSLILIIGLPVTGLFLLSIRGIALMEGRIVEALLSLRMPRKPLFVRKGLGWKDKLKALITESYTWKAMAYMTLHLPLGLLYSIGIALMLSISIKCILYPLWYWNLGRPLITFSEPIYPPVWSIPLISIAGILLVPLTLHFARFVGKIHGRFAKSMLVIKQ